MVFKWIGLAVAAGVLFCAGVASAQGTGKSDKLTPAARVHGTPGHKSLWYKLCLDALPLEPAKPGASPKAQKPEEMKKVNVCITQADVRDNATAILVGKVGVRQAPGAPRPQIMAMLPLTSAIPPGAFVRIDDKEPIKLTYSTCDQAGCYAEADIEPAFLNQLKSGKQVAYLALDPAGRPTAVPLPLEGFGEALDGPPMPLETFQEAERKIAEFTKARLAELRKQQGNAAQAQANVPGNADKKSK